MGRMLDLFLCDADFVRFTPTVQVMPAGALKLASHMPFSAKIRSTITLTFLALDDKLVATEQMLSRVAKKPALICKALKTLIARESARHLGSLDGVSCLLTATSRKTLTVTLALASA